MPRSQPQADAETDQRAEAQTGHNRLQHSMALFEEARKVMPGGNTRTTVFRKPYPIYFDSGSGAHVTDVDGNEYLDFDNNFTSLIHGHSYAPAVSAVQAQSARAFCFGAPTDVEIELARLLCERVPGFEHVRFMCSGTEAVMNAVKAARAYTGRPLIAKNEGAYHGSFDPVEVSLDSSPGNWGEASRPASVPFCRGTPDHLIADTVVIPYNDVSRTRAILEAHHDTLAAVIVDPMASRIGLIPVEPDYLEFLRSFTASKGILLISDEVLNFRLSYEGGIASFGQNADLCAFGKIIGGGLPIGAVAGPSKYMAIFDPSDGKPPVPQSGTFAANPLSLAAGLATMQGMTRDAFATLASLGDYAREALTDALSRENLPCSVTGLASLLRLHFKTRPPTTYREAYMTPANRNALEALARFAGDKGVFIPPTGLLCLSTAMEQADVDAMVEIIVAGLRRTLRDR